MKIIKKKLIVIRHIIVTLICLIITIQNGICQDIDSNVKWYRSKEDMRWVYGKIQLGASKDQIWNVLSNVEKWAEIFQDIKTIKVHKKHDNILETEVDAISMTHKTYWNIKLSPPNKASFKDEGHGIIMEMIFFIEEEPINNTCMVNLHISIESDGFIGWFIPDSELRKRQEKMVVQYLNDIKKELHTGDKSHH